MAAFVETNILYFVPFCPPLADLSDALGIHRSIMYSIEVHNIDTVSKPFP